MYHPYAYIEGEAMAVTTGSRQVFSGVILSAAAYAYIPQWTSQGWRDGRSRGRTTRC